MTGTVDTLSLAYMYNFSHEASFMYRSLERGYKRATSSSNERAVLSCANDVKQGAWRVKLWSEAINFFFFFLFSSSEASLVGSVK